MPLLVGHVAAPPTPQPTLASDLAVATWTAPDGTQWVLTHPPNGWFTVPGPAGLGISAVGMATDANPRGGARVRHQQPGPKLITWPLYVEGANHAELLARWRALALAFAQTQDLTADGTYTPGTLRVARPDGSAREIAAFLQSGFEGEPERGWRDDLVVLTLFCEDPFWRGTVAETVVREFSTGVPFLDPYPTVSSSQVLGESTIVNPGDVIAWPEWTITGPTSLVTATNLTTGEEFVVDPDFDGGGSLGVGETVTITTDPPTVRGPAGEIWTGAINWPGAQLWGLRRGVNDVEFTMAGASAGSRIQLSYVPRYKSA